MMTMMTTELIENDRKRFFLVLKIIFDDDGTFVYEIYLQ